MNLITSLGEFVDKTGPGKDLVRTLANQLLGHSFPADPKRAGGISSSDFCGPIHTCRFRLFSGAEGKPVPELKEIKLLLSDFDGLEVQSEHIRQKCWFITARSPKWNKFFGGSENLTEISDKILGEFLKPDAHRSLFEDTIGAAESKFEEIITSIARTCCQKAGVEFDSDNFSVKEFKKDRDALVDKAIKHGWLQQNRGLRELYDYARWAEIPLCIVTQSKKEFVESVLKKIFGEKFEIPLIVSKEDLGKYSLSPKPDPQPYRFATILMTLKKLESDGVIAPNAIFESEESRRLFAASLSRFSLNSDSFKYEISERLGANAQKFLKFLPANDECLVLEDSDKGAKAGREVKVALVSNGVDKIAHKLSIEPNLMNEKQIRELDAMVASLQDEETIIHLAAKDLRGVVDYLRVTNPVPVERLKQIVLEERPEIDLKQSYVKQAAMVASYLGIKEGMESNTAAPDGALLKTLTLGSYRSVDDLIVEHLKKMELNSRILEIGSGTTVPLFTSYDGGMPKANCNFSSPALSRLLSSLGYDVVALDMQSDQIEHRGKLTNGILVGTNSQGSKLFCGYFEHLGLKVENILKDSMYLPQKEAFQILQGTDAYRQFRVLDSGVEDPVVSIFPMISSKLERDLFGLKVFGGVDVAHLDRYIYDHRELSDAMKTGFDLIFRRNAAPVTTIEQTLIRDVLPYLRSGGSIVYEISKSSFSREGSKVRYPQVFEEKEVKDFVARISTDLQAKVIDLGDADVIFLTKQ